MDNVDLAADLYDNAAVRQPQCGDQGGGHDPQAPAVPDPHPWLTYDRPRGCVELGSKTY
jgi:hypothetical protein